MFISKFLRNSPAVWRLTPRASLASRSRRSLLSEMDGLLKAHGVFLDLTLEDVQKDSDAAIAPSR
jgi:hypothetical protein